MFTSESDKEEQVHDSDGDAEFIRALNNSFDMSEELKKPYMNIDTLDDIQEMIQNLRILRKVRGSLDPADEKELTRLQGIRNNRVYRQKLKLKK